MPVCFAHALADIVEIDGGDVAPGETAAAEEGTGFDKIVIGTDGLGEAFAEGNQEEAEEEGGSEGEQDAGEDVGAEGPEAAEEEREAEQEREQEGGLTGIAGLIDVEEGGVERGQGRGLLRPAGAGPEEVRAEGELRDEAERPESEAEGEEPDEGGEAEIDGVEDAALLWLGGMFEESDGLIVTVEG